MTIRTLPKGIPARPNPKSCGHMAYMPQSSPDFDGDLQHDFRDYEMGRSLDFLSAFVGKAAEHDLKAAALTGQADQVLVDCLQSDDRFDAQVFFDVHWLLARFWRAHHMRDHLRKPCLWVYDTKGRDHIAGSYIGLHLLFVKWGLVQIDHWALNYPQIIRLICMVAVFGNTFSGRMSLQALMDQLRKGFDL